jgi:hypothetical protein
LKQGDISVLQLQRFHLLKDMIDMMPANAQIAHKNTVYNRHHLENLSFQAFAQVGFVL